MVVAALVTAGLFLLMIALIAPIELVPPQIEEKIRLIASPAPQQAHRAPARTPRKPRPLDIEPLAERLGAPPEPDLSGWSAPAGYGDFVIVVRLDEEPPRSSLTEPAPYRACFAEGEEEALVSVAFSLDAASRPVDITIPYATHRCAIPYVVCDIAQRRYQMATGPADGSGRVELVRVLRPSDLVAEDDPCAG